MLTVSSSVIYQFQLARYILFALNSNQSDSKNDNNCSNVHVVLVDLIFTPVGLCCGAWALRAGNNNRGPKTRHLYVRPLRLSARVFKTPELICKSQQLRTTNVRPWFHVKIKLF